MRRLTFALVVLMAATLPLESAYAVPFGGSLTKLFGILAAASWLVTVYATGGLRTPRAAHVAALLFVLWNAASMLWSLDVSATQTRVLTYAQLLGLMLVLWDSVRTLSQLTLILLADVLGCWVAAGSLVLAYVAQGPEAAVHGRFTLGAFNPNDAGLILALGLPVAAYLLDAPPFTGRARTAARVVAATYLPLGAFAILGTGSRSAVLAALAALCYSAYLLARRGPRHVVAGLVALAGVTAALLPLLPSGAVVRLLATGQEVGEGNLNDRQQVWPEALRLIQEHPGLGVGGGAFRTAAVSVNKVGHNFVLALLAELGVVGLGLFCAVLVLAFLAARRAPAGLASLWGAVAGAWLSGALLHNWEHRKLTWVLLALMVVSGALRRETPPSAGQTRSRSSTGPAARVPVLRQMGDATRAEPALNRDVVVTGGP